MACFGQDHFYDIDDETSNLIINLQIEDAELQLSSANRKGKGREGELTDVSLAFELQKQELENLALNFSDRRMTQSIANAVQTDGPIVMNTMLQENIATRDRDLVQGLGANTELPNTSYPNPDPESHELDDELLTKYQALFVSGFILEQNPDLGAGDHAESSTWAASRVTGINSIKGHCEACGDETDFVDVGRVPCRHEYCRDCLQNLFKTAITDESLFPPRCCGQQIPLDKVRIFLTSELAQALSRKRSSSTLQTKRIARCRPARRSLTAETSPITLAHAMNAARRLVRYAKQQRMTEASVQMIQRFSKFWIWCRCGAQFCYTCGVSWKNCGCAQWDENRLYDRANRIADRGPGAARMNRVARAALVERTAQNLRDNHECNHGEWRFVHVGGRRCEECRQTLSDFIFECRGCQLQACKRCKNNRLQG